MVSDIHFKMIAFIFRCFDVIIGPKLGVGRMLGGTSVLTAETRKRCVSNDTPSSTAYQDEGRGL